MESILADRNLALEAVRVTESAALEAASFIGAGDERLADHGAVSAAHSALGALSVNGTIRVGENKSSSNQKLYVGERIGIASGPKVDIAILPLEGKSIVARGGPNALSCLAIAEEGGFLNVPDIYMDKLVVGPGVPVDIVDLDAELEDNLNSLAKWKGVKVTELIVCMLDRPRHNLIVEKLRKLGVRIRLIQDGDVSGALLTSITNHEIDLYMGIGSAPQGVLASAALRCMGGYMQGRLFFKNDEERRYASELGVKELDRKYHTTELASGNVTFAATGVTYGAILQGIRIIDKVAVSHSLVVRSFTGTFRYVEAHHEFAFRKHAQR